MSTIQETMYNANIITTCLKMLLDDNTYQKVVSRKNFKLPEKNQWINWSSVEKIMENVRNVISNYDHVMEDIKALRHIDGSALLFNTGKCIDFQVPTTLTMETRPTSALKQDWIKALPFVDNFYQTASDKKLFKEVMEHELDKLAASIQTAQIVTLRCPKIDLQEMVDELRDDIRRDKCEDANTFVQEFMMDLKESNEDPATALKKDTYGDSDRQSVIDTIDLTSDRCVERALYIIYKAWYLVSQLDYNEELLLHELLPRPFDRIKTVRTARNGSIIFTACNPGKYPYIPTSKLDKYLDLLGLEYGIINPDVVTLKDISLHSDVITPIVSSYYTLCIEASTIVKTVMDILRKKMRCCEIEEMTKNVKTMGRYILPKYLTTYCMDYKEAMQLLEEVKMKTTDKSGSNATAKNIKSFIDMEAKKRVFGSFQGFLTTLLSNYQSLPSEKIIEEIIEQAETLTLLFEYPQLAHTYHGQNMCKSFCSLSLLEKDHERRCEGMNSDLESKLRKMILDKKVIRNDKKDDATPAQEEETRNLKVENARMTEELEQLKKECQVLKKNGEGLKKEMNDRRKMEVQLKKKTDELREQWNSSKATINSNKEQHAANMRKLKEQLEKAKKEVDVWKMKFEMGNPTDISLSVHKEFTIGFYLDIITNTRKQLNASKAQLQGFLSVSTSTTDKKRAEREFKVFEWDANTMIEKAEENVVILTKDPECPVDELMKIGKLPAGFSKMTMVKMEEAKKKDCEDCFICLDEMCETSKLFNCIVCAAQCHQSCYQTWAANNSSCPLCRQSFPDSNEFPAL